MLVERGVSANSTFQKELSKIVFDSRYLLLSANERKSAFEEYANERAEIERAEKKAKAKVAKEKYMELLQEAELDGKSKFASFSTKYGKDERYKDVEKHRDREDFFNDYVNELYQKEKVEKQKVKEEVSNINPYCSPVINIKICRAKQPFKNYSRTKKSTIFVALQNGHTLKSALLMIHDTKLNISTAISAKTCSDSTLPPCPRTKYQMMKAESKKRMNLKLRKNLHLSVARMR